MQRRHGNMVRRAARAICRGSLCLWASQAAAEGAPTHGVMPWTEAVVSVTEFERATSLFRHAGNWRLTHSGSMTRAELDYYRLPDEATGDFERWCAPKADSGCVHFVSFSGVDQAPIRPAARAWDTGGIFSIMIRSDDIPALYGQALDLGWWAESPPISFQFRASDLRNVVLTGPHGLGVAVYERVSPAFTAFPVGRMSQGFNSMRMVRNRVKARAFYTDILGFDVLFDSDSEPAEPAPSNFGIPLNLTPSIKRTATALHPVAGETGRVEVMQIEGFTGLDHADRAVPPNLGILSVRYPVRDLAGYRQMVTDRGADIVYSGTGIAIASIGQVDIFAVRDPDGNITEFYSHAD